MCAFLCVSKLIFYHSRQFFGLIDPYLYLINRR